MTDDEDVGLRPTLREDSRARARARILQGGSIAVARLGLDATIDEIADEAGVSRRTVFRHFAHHGELIAAIISETILAIGSRLPRPPAPEDDVEKWLTNSLVAIHTMVRQLVGRAFWDIHVEKAGLPPEAAEALKEVADRRRQYATDLATTAWTALDGGGDPPDWVVDAFILHAWGFATFALASRSAEETGELSARILWLVLMSAIRDRDALRSTATA